jgi:hypothetical protein
VPRVASAGGYVPAVTASYSQPELDAALDAITEPGRLREAESVVATAAPGLQRILAQALAAGGWFDEAHENQVRKAAGVASDDERLMAVRTLLAEETRMGMMIGVAIGWALAEELRKSRGETATEED